MNILKTPQQMLLEEAGMTPASPGMLKTPQQLLLEESGVQPKFFSDGGSSTNQMSPEMLRALMQAYDYAPNKLQQDEPTFEAQPQTATTWMRDKIARLIGETPADRLFGTGSEGQQMEYLPLQILNPLSAAGTVVDAVPEMYRQYRQGDIGGAALTGGIAGLSAIPFTKPIGKAVSAISKKTKK
tara:strand:+ start:873 stop:1424 length:552 start_codon:yes stop_codon:yes gene_type:complete